ncbi:MAG TPA: hypothetical protein VM282_14430 [Acidimicrobiales bacterium]|nr:hypothetical protein [Acidimicrobiales bacterium]
MKATSSSAVRAQETVGGDCVREHTDAERVSKLDHAMQKRVAGFIDASPSELTESSNELEQESDIERILEINASALALTGVLLGMFRVGSS